MTESRNTCSVCRFWDGYGETGRCRRRSPLVTGGMMSAVETVWPIVSDHDWCGDFETFASAILEATQ